MKQIIFTLAIAVLFFFIGSFTKPPVIIATPTEYHFNVDSSGYDIYSEDMKLVGRINYGVNPSLDSLIDNDNQ